MGYVALYRKFRPNEFEEVKGQNHIVTALRNQIKSNRVGHAYLFSGTRGTGKTTIAKIMAKAVNCENSIDGSPCNECTMCKAINSQTSLNVIEIDAASNNGVDNIRQIVEEVQYSPTEGKYKVYIIDEVHMLSTGAFNALLKTLEEPPNYVIFILATTEMHKIPVTILSRCQRYEFKRLQVSTIAQRLNELVERENIDVDEKAITYIAKCADGAMRDALSLLDQCVSFLYGQTLTYEAVLEVLGAVDTDIFMELLKYILEGKVSAGIKLIERIVLEGKDLSQFVINFTWFLRNVMLVKTSENSLELVDLPEDKINEMRIVSIEMELDTLMRYIRIFSELSNQLKYATQKRVLLETAFVNLCKPQMDTDMSAYANRLDNVERKLEKGYIQAGSAEVAQTHEEKIEDDEISEEDKKKILDAMPEDIKEVARIWGEVLKKTPMAYRDFLSRAKPCLGNDNTLLLVFDDELSFKSISSEIHLTEISNIITSIINKNVMIRTYKNGAGSSAETMSHVDISKLINLEVTYVD